MASTKFLQHEAEIVWLEDPSKYDYVRAAWALAGTRIRPISGIAGHILGYATLRPDAPSVYPRKWYRRVFHMLEGDRGADKDEGAYRTG